MWFRCGICHEECDLKDFAFSYTIVSEDGSYEEGVCGTCADEDAP